MTIPATALEDSSVRAWGTATAAVLGVALVLSGLWLGVRDFAADSTRLDGTRVSLDCGSAFSNLSGGGVRDLLSPGVLFSGREGCDPVVGMALVGALGGLSIGVLLVAVAAVRFSNRSPVDGHASG